jgi:hypothetical protein
MNWTTILLLRFGVGLMAMVLAYVICVSAKKIVASIKKALAFINSFRSAHFHQTWNKTQVDEFNYKLH